MDKAVKIGDCRIGDGCSVYIVAEIGINHNGDLEIAKRLIDAAVHAGCNAVKFQKRSLEFCIPLDQCDIKRDTPWGYITYLEYRKKIELGFEEYKEIDRYCKKKNITWFASCWDQPSVDFIQQFDTPVYKVSSPSLTDIPLLRHIKHREAEKSIILSTGMSTMRQIRDAVGILGTDNLILVHSTSTYPCCVEELNLRVIETLRGEFPCPVGYSGHEVGLPTALAAVTLGACYVERHITLDRSMWGTDQAASIEPGGFARLVKYIRVVERAMGDGVKRIYNSEMQAMNRLRKVKK